MIKKDYKKVHLYILGNSRKIAIFFGFTPYTYKKSLEKESAWRHVHAERSVLHGTSK